MVTDVHVYGIRNCDTIKKVRSWLEAHEIAYAFHDYKVEGANRAALESWCRVLGWEAVLNRGGTTFKSLSESKKAGLTLARSIDLMLAQPSMIKRPIVVVGDKVMAGFKAEAYEKFFL